MEVLQIPGNEVSDLTPVMSLERLKVLEVWGNPLNAVAKNRQIPSLESRGITVSW